MILKFFSYKPLGPRSNTKVRKFHVVCPKPSKQRTLLSKPCIRRK